MFLKYQCATVGTSWVPKIETKREARKWVLSTTGKPIVIIWEHNASLLSKNLTTSIFFFLLPKHSAMQISPAHHSNIGLCNLQWCNPETLWHSDVLTCCFTGTGQEMWGAFPWDPSSVYPSQVSGYLKLWVVNEILSGRASVCLLSWCVCLWYAGPSKA